MTPPQRRWCARASADEVAQLAVYLASDDAAWVTGEIYRIDGGQG